MMKSTIIFLTLAVSTFTCFGQSDDFCLSLLQFSGKLKSIAYQNSNTTSVLETYELFTHDQFSSIKQMKTMANAMGISLPGLGSGEYNETGSSSEVKKYQSALRNEKELKHEFNQILTQYSSSIPETINKAILACPLRDVPGVHIKLEEIGEIGSNTYKLEVKNRSKLEKTITITEITIVGIKTKSSSGELDQFRNYKLNYDKSLEYTFVVDTCTNFAINVNNKQGINNIWLTSPGFRSKCPEKERVEKKLSIQERMRNGEEFFIWLVTDYALEVDDKRLAKVDGSPAFGNSYLAKYSNTGSFNVQGYGGVQKKWKSNDTNADINENQIGFFNGKYSFTDSGYFTDGGENPRKLGYIIFTKDIENIINNLYSDN